MNSTAGSTSRGHLQRALEKAHRILAVLEEQAAGYTSLTVPAHLQVELEEKRKEVARLEKRLAQLESRPASLTESLWDVILRHQRSMALVGLGALVLFTFGWIGITGWPHIRGWYAVVASREQLRPLNVSVRQTIQRWCPLPVEPARDGEILIIVSPFDKSGPIDRKFATRITEDLRGADIEGVRIGQLPPDRIIRDNEEAQARALGEITNATLVIWGWFDGDDAAPHYEVIPKQTTEVKLQRIENEPDSFHFWVDEGMPQGMVYLTEFTVGQVRYLAGQYEQALAYFDEALDALEEVREGFPQEEPYPWGEEYVYFYRGATQFNQALKSQETDDYRQAIEQAISDYEQAIAHRDEFADAYNNLGVAYADLAGYEIAVENSESYREGIGHYNSAIENYDEAIAIYDEARKIGQNDVERRLGAAYYNRGNALYNLREFTEATADYEEAIPLLPPDHVCAAHYNCGLAYAQSQNHEKAIEHYDRVIEELPDESADFYLARGSSYWASCEYEDALKDFSTVIEKFEDDQDAMAKALTNRGAIHTRWGEIHSNQDEYSKALKDYDEALSLDPDCAMAHYNLAATKSLQDLAGEAMEELCKAIELDSDLAYEAACDSDFDGIRGHEGLPELVPPPGGCLPDPCR